MMPLQLICNLLNALRVNFSQTESCLRESPITEKYNCWLNTNYLAVHVLKMCNNVELANNVMNFLSHYDSYYWDTGNGYRILWLQNRPWPRQINKLFFGVLTDANGDKISILADYLGSELLHDFYNYADQLEYGSLIALYNRDFKNARSYLMTVRKMWNGVGFIDASNQGINQYETYKVSLYYYLARAMNFRDEITKWFEDNVDQLIWNQNGIKGITTVYTVKNGIITPLGDPNVETNSITALALFSDYPLRFPASPAQSYSDFADPLIYIPLAIGLAALGWIIARRIQRAKVNKGL